jgi:C-terminal processing protease CtpA/Prc
VKLHDQPVVQAHRRHFGQHLRPEQFGLLGVKLPLVTLANSASASAAERLAVWAVGWP